MKWRYQPVFAKHGAEGETVFSLIEAHFDDNDRLASWTDGYQHPQGESRDGLMNDIARMLADVFKWVPVDARDLKVGMVFQRAISQEDADGIADIVGAAGKLANTKTRSIQ